MRRPTEYSGAGEPDMLVQIILSKGSGSGTRGMVRQNKDRRSGRADPSQAPGEVSRFFATSPFMIFVRVATSLQHLHGIARLVSRGTATGRNEV